MRSMRTEGKVRRPTSRQIHTHPNGKGETRTKLIHTENNCFDIHVSSTPHGAGFILICCILAGLHPLKSGARRRSLHHSLKNERSRGPRKSQRLKGGYSTHDWIHWAEPLEVFLKWLCVITADYVLPQRGATHHLQVSLPRLHSSVQRFRRHEGLKQVYTNTVLPLYYVHLLYPNRCDGLELFYVVNSSFLLLLYV